ncbi:MAG: hypothetical protein JXB49_08800 [Bacteroidales bacterium]|nr:hypothetical protein [Bacteroidales bacterium]
MRIISIVFLLTLSQSVLAQPKSYKIYVSSKWGYSIEYQTIFSPREATGRNVDFKVGDSIGNSIIVIVKKLMPHEEKVTVDDLLSIPTSTWENNLQLPNVKVIKKGIVYVDNKKGMFLHYTSKDLVKNYTLYYTNYFFYYKGYNYTLTGTCDINNLNKMQPVFFRAFDSFIFPK